MDLKLPVLKNSNQDKLKLFEDHRIAMTGVIANLAINDGIKPDNIDCISDSYPSFFSDLEKIGANYDN